MFKRFEEIFSVLDSEVGGASSEVGVGSAAEYNMVVEVMMRDASGESIKESGCGLTELVFPLQC